MDNLVSDLKDRPKSLDILKIPNLRKDKSKKDNSILADLKSKTHSKFFSAGKLKIAKNKLKAKAKEEGEGEENEDNKENDLNEDEFNNELKLKSAENFHNRSKSPINVTDKTLLYELRNTFQKSLAKLNNNDTKEVGYKELVNIITKFNNSQSLRVFISLLSISHKNCSIAAKELQVMLIGVIAQVFQENLQDPLDKPPTIIKTIERLIRVIQGFMKENSDIVHYACAETLVQLYKNCMPKDNIVQIVKLFIDYPVISIESGIHLMAQKANALALSSIMNFLKSEGGEIILDQIALSIIKLVVKTSFDSPYLFECLLILIQTVKFEYFSNNFKELYEKLVFVLDNTKSFDNSKINCCRLLKLIGEKIKISYKNLIGFYISDITNALKNTTKDRVHKVQLAARDALKIWIEVEKINADSELKKMNVVIERGKNDDIEDLKKKIINKLDQNDIEEPNQNANSIFNYNNQNKLNLLRNLSKINNADSKDRYISNYSNLSKEQLFKKGVTNMLRISGSQEKSECVDNTEYHLKYGRISGKDKLLPSDLVKQSLKNLYSNNADLEDSMEMSFQMPVSKVEPIKKVIENPNQKMKTDLPNISNYNHNYKKKIEINDELAKKNDDSLEEDNKIHINNLKENNRSGKSTENLKPSKSPKLNQRRTENKLLSNQNLKNKNSSNHNTGNIVTEVNKPINKENVLNLGELKNFKSIITSSFKNYVNSSMKNFSYLNNNLDKIEKKLNNLESSTKQIIKKVKLSKAKCSNQVSTNEKENNLDTGVNNNNRDLEQQIKDLKEQSNNQNETIKDLKKNFNLLINEKQALQNEMLKQQSSNQISGMNKLNYNIDSNSKKSAEETPKIVNDWVKIINFAEKGNFNSAYEEVLNTGDDIYLIRLMYLTGPSFDKMNQKLCKQLVFRASMIARSHQVQNLTLNFIKAAFEKGLFLDFNKVEQNDLLETLFEISSLNSRVGKSAAKLYSKICSELSNSNFNK